jgi:hypothetical protein
VIDAVSYKYGRMNCVATEYICVLWRCDVCHFQVGRVHHQFYAVGRHA